MRLKISKNKAEEQLIDKLIVGYQIQNFVLENYSNNITQQNFETNKQIAEGEINKWNQETANIITIVFPTNLQWHYFNRPPVNRLESALQTNNGDIGWDTLQNFIKNKIIALHRLLEIDIKLYTDFPIGKRLYVEDIDSFRNVRDINADVVKNYLDNGYFDKSEDEVQIAFEQILNESFHKKDWVGEENDLYSTNIIINGQRTSCAFLLKGNGLRKNSMEIKDCGRNGDQIVRLFQSPAQIYFIQFVGNISENIIKDIEGKINERNLRGENISYCAINGQDTARLLKAYDKLN